MKNTVYCIIMQNKKIEETFELVKPTAVSDMGKIMNALSSLKGKADMSLVSKKVREKISSL